MYYLAFIIIIIILSFSKIFIHLFDLVNMMLLQRNLPIKKIDARIFFLIKKKRFSFIIIIIILFIRKSIFFNE